jgi:hypothetical protein
MIDRQPNCVYVADNSATADVIVMLLKGNGIVAQTIEPAKAGLSVKGIEIWVDEPAQADRARKLIPQLTNHLYELLFDDQTGDAAVADESARQLKETRQFKAWKSKKIELNPVKCDECGKVSGFPASQAGTVQECPHCAGFMDVPELAGAPESPFPPEMVEPDME